MPLVETIPIDTDEICRLAREHWNVEVDKCLRASQNHTFLASNNAGERFILRVTPDPNNQRNISIQLEVTLLEYLHKNQLPVCRALRTANYSSSFIRSNSFILCLFEFATGEPIVITDWLWLTDREKVVGLGQWCARLHTLTRCFAQENPELVAQARHWTAVHDGVLAEVEIDERDQELIAHPTHFGLIHGDINPSNYFWVTNTKMPCMFDWDELQNSWFLYDLSAPIWFVMCLERPNSPFHPTPVPQANSELFTTWLLEGYELDGEHGTVDRAALKRMVLIRRELYKRFARRAVNELPADHWLVKFCEAVNVFFDNEDKQKS